eukprot:GEMP01046630.1.p1 GENE.GEMP01046630.1~~GEMP01046630.1.p1  ORF type:complete len:466 (-),score=115.74 GEMP01046630.1:247-1644(-)
MSDAAALSAKIQKFGVLGGSVIPDSLALIQAPAKKDPEPKGLTRSELVELLNEQVQYLEVSTKAVGDLAHELAKLKKVNLTFQDAHKKILAIGLPREPLELHKMSEHELRDEVMKYEGDQEIEGLTERLVPTPPPMGRPSKNLSASEIMDIHDFMAETLAKIIRDFSSLTQEIRHKISHKGVEVTAELLVSVAVEKRFDVRSEDVELSLIQHEAILQNEQRFQEASQGLSAMLQALLSYGKPRLDKEKFAVLLGEMATQGVEAKTFMKQMALEYSNQQISVAQAYEKFQIFANDAKELSDVLSPMEMKACYEGYKHHEDIADAWERSGQEMQITLQMMMSGTLDPNQLPQPSKKLKKLKTHDVINMQEYMVEQLKSIVGEIVQAVDSGCDHLKDELAIPLIQGLASAAVEKQYGISAEEMTMAGFVNRATLCTNERFLKATTEQQQILMQIPRICQDGAKGCCIM